jgi:hypothetical protein
MEAKEKAKELVDKFKIRVTITFSEDSVPCVLNAPMINESAKKCALICVDEILKSVTTIADKKFDYYTEVKKEINQL